MSCLRVVSWNAEGMFVEGSLTKRATPRDALAVVRELDADIMVVPEFGVLDRLESSTRCTLRDMGYELYTSTYNDPRVPGLGMAVLSRRKVVHQEEFSLADTFRCGLSITVTAGSGKFLRIIGVHLDDKSEKARLAQIKRVVEQINSDSISTILAGDFNAMDARSWFARIMRSPIINRVGRLLPPEKLRSIVARLGEMATGTTIDFLMRHTHLQTLDLKRHATVSGKQAGLEWVPSVRLAKIDWIFGTPNVKPLSYKVWRDVGSDHRPICAEIDYSASCDNI